MKCSENNAALKPNCNFYYVRQPLNSNKKSHLTDRMATEMLFRPNGRCTSDTEPSCFSHLVITVKITQT